MIKDNNNGFSLLAVIVIIAAIGLVAGCGYMVARNSQAAKNKTGTAVSGDVASENPVPPAVQQPAKTKTLAIKEWGIEIPLTESISDAYYVISKVNINSDGSANTIWLGLKSRDSQACAAALGNTGGSTLGAIVRTPSDATDPISGEFYSELYAGVVIDGSFYGYGSSVDPHNMCGSVESRANINEAFSKAAKNVRETENATIE